MIVRVKLLNERATPPERRPDGVGVDMHATHDALIQPGQHQRVRLGLAWEIPEGYVGLALQRSGMGSELKLSIVGVIDDTYRGEVCATLWNAAQRGDWNIKAGDRVCQMVVVPAPVIEIELASELSDSCRGDRGFGSTGR
jgi:dUTP pyrophosphatase